MSSPKDELTQARAIFLRHRYVEVLRLLTPQIFVYRDNPEYYRMMGISSLHTGDFSAAHSYFLRGIDLDPHDVRILEGLALTCLGRKDRTEAVRIWLMLQELRPGNRRAFQGLKLVQSTGDEIDWTKKLREPECIPLYPEPPFNSRRFFLAGLGVVAGLCLAVVLVWGIISIVKKIQDDASKTLEARLMAPSPAKDANLAADIGSSGFPEIAYDVPKEHLDPFQSDSICQEMREYFNQYRDNKVRFLVNRILLSDAPEKNRQQALNLVSHIREAKFTNFKDPVDLAEVASRPWLYQGTYVRWAGSVSKVQVLSDRIDFELLVGYENGKVSQGMVPVSVRFPVDLKDTQSVELIGEVNIDRKIKGQFALRGTSIRLIRGNS